MSTEMNGTMEAGQVRIKSIKIEGLFRQYSHVIPLNQEDRVTVIHGRNGVGKTAVLYMVTNLLQGNYHKLARFPFERFRIDFSDDSIVEVRMEKELAHGGRIPSRKRLEQEPATGGRTLIGPGLEIKYAVQGGERKFFSVSSFIKTFLGTPENIKNTPAPSFLHSDETPSMNDGWWEEVSLSADSNEPRFVRLIREQVPVHFIETQRLSQAAVALSSRNDDFMTIQAVQSTSKELVERIKGADSDYRAASTRLDNTLPHRLFASPPGASPVQEEELEVRAEALEQERRRLQRIGLIEDITHFSLGDLNEAQRAIFAVYLKDSEEKLEVFKDLADRAEILLDIINRKFAPKQVKIDRVGGYSVHSHDGRPLDLDMLSSGEQHELLLLHSLLFRVRPGSLLLIDEPELSLHVTWQDEFLEDLIKIAKKVGFDAVVATHSPYIVGSRRELMVRLGEPVGGESA